MVASVPMPLLSIKPISSDSCQQHNSTSAADQDGKAGTEAEGLERTVSSSGATVLPSCIIKSVGTKVCPAWNTARSNIADQPQSSHAPRQARQSEQREGAPGMFLSDQRSNGYTSRKLRAVIIRPARDRQSGHKNECDSVFGQS